ncbi:hypothetical protein [Pseudooceanicola onchidii]|uniref:hypothetical protein n=1 Tax=Pseudooceanicola onchidii TaxID=2562279 RepID=UPI0010AA6EA7|nr:hypothetical protein [Pseudooceanicola onchidii]
MPRLVLHIGTHKTGTTMIQNRLHDLRNTLADHGVIYPDLGRHTGHHGYLTDWIALPEAYRSANGGRAGLQQLAQRWRDSDVTLLLSSEEFSRAGGRGGTVDFRDLAAIFDGYDIQVICVLRCQWQFLQAVYLEVSQSTPPPPPARIVDEAIDTGQVDGLWCDYTRLYDGLREEFDVNAIRLVDYARAATSPHGLLREVMASVMPAVPIPPMSRHDNRSPPPLPVWAAHVVAGGPSPDGAIRRAAAEAYDLEYGGDRPGCIFTRAEMRRLSECCAPQNDRLANRVRKVQPGWTLSAPTPPDTTLYREDIRPEYWIRLARRLALQGTRHAA